MKKTPFLHFSVIFGFPIFWLQADTPAAGFFQTPSVVGAMVIFRYHGSESLESDGWWRCSSDVNMMFAYLEKNL